MFARNGQSIVELYKIAAGLECEMYYSVLWTVWSSWEILFFWYVWKRRGERKNKKNCFYERVAR